MTHPWCLLLQTPSAVYATFVMRVVADEDASRVVWPSCPALGWSTGVHKLTSMPNGKPLSTPDKTTTRCTNVAGAKCIEARPARLSPGAVTSHSCL